MKNSTFCKTLIKFSFNIKIYLRYNFGKVFQRNSEFEISGLAITVTNKGTNQRVRTGRRSWTWWHRCQCTRRWLAWWSSCPWPAPPPRTPRCRPPRPTWRWSSPPGSPRSAWCGRWTSSRGTCNTSPHHSNYNSTFLNIQNISLQPSKNSSENEEKLVRQKAKNELLTLNDLSVFANFRKSDIFTTTNTREMNNSVVERSGTGLLFSLGQPSLPRVIFQNFSFSGTAVSAIPHFVPPAARGL